jgi:hypothetical protein
MVYIVLAFLLFSPLAVSAQAGYNVQTLIINLGAFLNSAVMPFILAVAFLVFVFNTVRFFVVQGHTEDGRKNAKYLAIYSLGAFVFLLSFWGIVNIVVRGIGLGNQAPMLPDYVETKQWNAPFVREHIRQSNYCQQNPGSIDCL